MVVTPGSGASVATQLAPRVPSARAMFAAWGRDLSRHVARRLLSIGVPPGKRARPARRRSGPTSVNEESLQLDGHLLDLAGELERHIVGEVHRRARVLAHVHP